MMRVQAIASGSNGNSIYVEEEGTRILIDAGIPLKRIRAALQELGTDTDALDGVFLTHEHSDHVAGIVPLMNASSCPVYATEGTAMNVRNAKGVLLSESERFVPVRPYEPVKVGRFSVLPVPTYHDAKDPVFFRIDSPDRSFAVMTDTGRVDDVMVEQLSGLNGVLVESNHDVHMLEAGSYPYRLKRRILSDFGHLSNDSAIDLIGRILQPSLQVILLGHLSEENNYPDLVDLGIRQYLESLPGERKNPDLRFETAVRTHSSSVIEF